jgi:hypothetical protein
MVAASMYMVRRPDTSEMGEQNILPMVWPIKYLFFKVRKVIDALICLEAYIVTKAK